jgi:putative phage-type endonuclease
MSLTAEQLEARRKTIGASDVPVILGLSNYKSPDELYTEKTSTEPPLPSEDSEASRWGHKMEPLIVQAWGEARDGTVSLNSEVYHNLVHPWATCTPDGFLNGTVDDEDCGIEAKNRAYSSGWGPSGSQVIPPDVEAQVRWSMFVTGFPRWGVGVLLGGNTFRHYLLERDSTWEVWVLPLVEAFRGGIFQGEPAWRVPITTGKKLQATTDQVLLLGGFLDAKRELARMEGVVKVYDEAIREMIGENLGLISESHYANLSVVEGRKSVDWETVAKQVSPSPADLQEAITLHSKMGKPYRRLSVRKRGEAILAIESGHNDAG